MPAVNASKNAIQLSQADKHDQQGQINASKILSKILLLAKYRIQVRNRIAGERVKILIQGRGQSVRMGGTSGEKKAAHTLYSLKILVSLCPL